MEKTALVDQLIDRIDQLKDIVRINDDTLAIDDVLLQSIIDHADEPTIFKILEDVEKYIFAQDANDEPL